MHALADSMFAIVPRQAAPRLIRIKPDAAKPASRVLLRSHSSVCLALAGGERGGQARAGPEDAEESDADGGGGALKSGLRRIPVARAFGACSLAVLSLAHASSAQERADVGSPAYQWSLPAWAQAPPSPPDNPVTTAKVELGRRLFYDGRLAADGLRSCASCHKQSLGFSDNLPLSWGVTGELTARNAPSLTNIGYFSVLTWRDPRVSLLEVQALGPMFGLHPVEMGMAGQQAEMIRRVSEDETYRTMFAEAFGKTGEPITIDAITRALASFERTLVSFGSPYDRYRYDGEEAAISPQAKRGEILFRDGRLGCASCHSGVNFSDAADREPGADLTGPYHNTGLYNLDGRGAYPSSNTGLASATANPNDMGRFRTPTLRNVAVSGPYMHDGSIATLGEVIDFYAAGGRVIGNGARDGGDGRRNPYKDPRIAGFALTAQERADLIAFLESLTDEAFLQDPRHSDPWRAPASSSPATAAKTPN